MDLKKIDVTSSLMAYDKVLDAARSAGREPNTADRMLAMRAAIAAYEADAGTQRQIEVLAYERDYARAKYDHTFKVLMSVYNLLLSPDDIRLPDGRVFRFNDPNASETLRELGKAIRAIPERLAQENGKNG